MDFRKIDAKNPTRWKIVNKINAASNQNNYIPNLDLNFNYTKAFARSASEDLADLKTRMTALAGMILSILGESLINITLAPIALGIGAINYGIQMYNYLTTKNVTVAAEEFAESVSAETETATDVTATEFRIELAKKPEQRHLTPITEETSSQLASAASAEEASLNLDTLFAEPAEVTKDDVEEKRYELDEAPVSEEEEIEEFFVSKRVDTAVVKIAKFLTSWRKAS